MPWWFHAADHAARQAFVRREETKTAVSERIRVEAFDRQMTAIAAHWRQIAPIFQGHVLETLGADGKHMTHEEIFRAIQRR